MLQLFRLFPLLYRAISRKRLQVYVLLAVSIVLLCLINSVQASETILLQYRPLKTQVSLADLKAFAAERDTSPTLQQFWQATNENPAQVRQWLTAEIPLPESTQLIAPDFVLLQINKTLGDPLGRENLGALKSAFEKSLKPDRSFSVLELLQNYPESPVRLEVSRLEQAYTNANLLVTRIGPVVRIAEALLPELVCECGIASKTAPQPAELTASQANTDRQTSAVGKSLLPLSGLPLADVDSPAKTTAPDQADDLLVALETSSSPALAKKSLVFQFGPFGRSIPMQTLTRFAETGELSGGWRFFFNVAGVDRSENGVLYMTNHMVSDKMFARQEKPLSQSSLTRFERFAQLIEPGGQSFYGTIDPSVMVKIGRDRVNPHTLETTPLNIFDDDTSPGGNGSLRQGLYDLDKLLLWVAGGQPPVPESPFVCFSLGEMLNFPNPTPCSSPAL